MRKIVVTAVLTLLGAACGGTSSSSDTAPAASATPAAAATPQTIMFHMTEFKIDPGSLTLKPGDYTFQFMDEGKFPHDFHIALQGSSTELASTTKPMKAGEMDTLKVTLAKGVYVYWCGVGQHRKQGMEGSITVT